MTPVTPRLLARTGSRLPLIKAPSLRVEAPSPQPQLQCQHDELPHHEAAVGPQLLSIGVAVPPMCQAQDQVSERMARIWKLQGSGLARWRRIVAGSQIHTRHGVLEPEHVMHLSTAQRMAAFERFAPELGHRAASTAIDRAGLSPQCITDLIVVSCTGFAAPGLDVSLIESLGLRADVRRTMIGFMGCFGAISGLRTAVGACAAHTARHPVALVVAVELCSLHLRADDDPQNMVASALFADGAAAAVVRRAAPAAAAREGSAVPQPIGQLSGGSSLLLPLGKEWMSWRITDAGFAMTLTRDVPVALRESLDAYVQQNCAAQDLAQQTIANGGRRFIIHPGGPGVLDAAAQALQLRDDDLCLRASRDVLRRYGNMSSATVLFVLDEALQRGCGLPATLLAFGPGLTIESINLLP